MCAQRLKHCDMEEGVAWRRRFGHHESVTTTGDHHDAGIDCDSDDLVKTGTSERQPADADADAAIDCDTDNDADTDAMDTLQEKLVTLRCSGDGDGDGGNKSERSDSAMSSQQTSLASSFSNDKSTGYWIRETNAEDDNGKAKEWTRTTDDAHDSKSPDERQKYRRASSLKSSRSTDGPSSQQKKAVRFADALGLDLTSVKQLMDVEFGNPPSWCQVRADVLTRKVLRPVFEQPSNRFGVGVGFRQQVLNRIVLLENLLVNELTMVGSVRVANVTYHKRVFVRYTTDCWRHFADKEATYMALSCDGQTDRFSFTITAPADISEYGLAELCVCYVADGVQYWDNNDGRNYVCEVVLEELAAPYGSDLGD